MDVASGCPLKVHLVKTFSAGHGDEQYSSKLWMKPFFRKASFFTLFLE